ncbi:hypothetical protein SAMN02745704_00450 [Paucidesulfovibrio gracilis DSM 16080]|uniref:Uncharacterized protein n=1 Tax=Paucidesulfovibrio gracilis DSM 16080 TaxID=1121449 RepID=A0A1T4W5I5_9BACT|nr:hypothetical protein [Paucidesulfovibrio gracilis]SKA72584.1 hypothetical protein SAMN02745704_00450 [Paucidesulfovibrio gracilis DSM 16080]
MNKDEIAVKLLQIGFSHDQQIEAIGELGFDCSYFSISDNLEELALDVIGIPSDNTVELIKQYGEEEGMAHPDLFCRDWYTNVIYETMKTGSEIEAFRAIKTIKEDYAKHLQEES